MSIPRVMSPQTHAQPSNCGCVCKAYKTGLGRIAIVSVIFMYLDLPVYLWLSKGNFSMQVSHASDVTLKCYLSQIVYCFFFLLCSVVQFSKHSGFHSIWFKMDGSSSTVSKHIKQRVFDTKMKLPLNSPAIICLLW